MRCIMHSVYGSYLFGTAFPSSDRDYKSIYLPTYRQLLLGDFRSVIKNEEGSKQRKIAGERDEECYSLPFFFRLASEGQTVAIDMLFTPSEFLLSTSAVWEKIQKNREIFLSRKTVSFLGYARSQLFRYTARSKDILKLEEFLRRIDEVKKENPFVTMQDLWQSVFELADNIRINSSGITEMNLAGKWYGRTAKLSIIEDSVRRRLKNYGGRAREAAEINGADWKSLYSAVRVIREVRDLLKTGEIHFPLPYAEELKKIRRGELSLEAVQDIINRELSYVEEEKKESALPETVNQDVIEDFLVELLNEFVVHGKEIN